MKKRVIKKQFNKIAKKSIKENSYLYKKYGLYDRFIEELNIYIDFILNAKCIKSEVYYQGNVQAFINALNNYLDFILNNKCTKEIYYISNLKIYINNCIKDIENYIYNRILNKMIHY